MNNANENDKKNVFQERFRELVGDTATQEEIAKKVNTSRQNVGNWLNGKSKPDIYALAEIANGYNVSTDYLLGLTDIKTNDTTIQSICEYTGLSENAVSTLNNLDNPLDFDFEHTPSEDIRFLLNTVLENSEFYYLLLDICRKVRNEIIYVKCYTNNNLTKFQTNLDYLFFTMLGEDFDFSYITESIQRNIENSFNELVKYLSDAYRPIAENNLRIGNFGITSKSFSDMQNNIQQALSILDAYYDNRDSKPDDKFKLSNKETTEIESVLTKISDVYKNIRSKLYPYHLKDRS